MDYKVFDSSVEFASYCDSSLKSDTLYLVKDSKQVVFATNNLSVDGSYTVYTGVLDSSI